MRSIRFRVWQLRTMINDSSYRRAVIVDFWHGLTSPEYRKARNLINAEFDRRMTEAIDDYIMYGDNSKYAP